RAGAIMFFFSSRRRHTRSKRDWSSDVCSSDLDELPDSVTLAESETKLDHQGRVAFDTALPADTDIIYGDVRVVGQVSSARSTWVERKSVVEGERRGAGWRRGQRWEGRDRERRE